MKLTVQQIYLSNGQATITLQAGNKGGGWFGSLQKTTTIEEAKKFFVGQLIEMAEPQP